MRAGCSRIAITPPVGLAFGGKTHGAPIKITSVCQDIYARSLVFESEGVKIALVCVELCYLHACWVRRIREIVSKETDIPSGNIFVVATHNHSGPDTFLNVDEIYMEVLVGRVAESIRQANADLAEVRLGTGCRAILCPATNRRIRMKDGSVRMRVIGAEQPSPNLVVAPGPVDPLLRVLRIERSHDRRPLAMVANYGCHASVALESTCVSGDFPGWAGEVIESQTGALFFYAPAPSANINPLGFCENRSDDEARRIGRQFAEEVLSIADTITMRQYEHIEVRREAITFTIRRELLQTFGEVAPDSSPGSSTAWFPTSIREEVAKIRRMQETAVLPRVLETGQFPTEVGLVSLGDLSLLTIPGELFVETGMELACSAPTPCWIITHCNDSVGYIPTARAFAEGGYESAPFALSLLTEQAEATLKDTAAILWSRQ